MIPPDYWDIHVTTEHYSVSNTNKKFQYRILKTITIEGMIVSLHEDLTLFQRKEFTSISFRINRTVTRKIYNVPCCNMLTIHSDLGGLILQ